MADTHATHTCTLSVEGARERLPQARALTERLQHRERTADRLVLEFDDDGRTAALVDEFVRDERHCCSFFEFDTHTADDRVVLELTAPAEAAHMLDAAARAFDPDLDDEQRLALHEQVTGPPTERGGGQCGC